MTTFPIERFLNQSVSYQAFTGVNNRDDPTYAGAVSLAARYVEVDREHYARDEDVHQARSKLWLETKPVLRSLIDGREVISVSVLVSIDGTSVAWVANLR